MVVLLAMNGVSVLAASPSPSVSTVIPPATPIESPTSSDALLYEAILPEYRGAVMAATDQRLSRYTIAATLHPADVPVADGLATPLPAGGATPVAVSQQPATITGMQELRFVNSTATPLTDLYFRLYPNLRQYGDGSMRVRDITVDGVAIAPEPPPLYADPLATPAATPDAGSRDLLLIRLPMSRPIPPEGTAMVRMAFTTTVPLATPDGPGAFAFDPDSGAWTLAQWFPMLAGYDPGTGWELDPPADWNDPAFANSALFDVTLTAPSDLVLVTTGHALLREATGAQQVQRFVSGPVPDFAVVADPTLEATSSDINGTTVTSYYRPEDAAGGAQILEWAGQALAVFTELFGPYPFSDLDVVAVPNVIGLEFPGMIFIAAAFYPDPVAAGSRPDGIEFLVAYEISHQWWYGLVGNNQYRHAFLDEGLAEYSAVLYFERQHGLAAADDQLDAGLRLPYAAMLLTDEDRIVDQPSADFPDDASYFTTIYRKGGLGFAALRHEIGDAAFFAGLRSYAASMSYEVASPDDLRSAFEAASGRNLDTFWHLWFETANGRVEIIVEADQATPTLPTPVT